MKRTCGTCQLCCKLLPVNEGLEIDGVKLGGFQKPANQRCCHQRTGKGCAVYNQPGMPRSCSIWNCRWLVDPATHEMQRPERTHYVIDIMPDFITAVAHETGQRHTQEVIVVWIDPAFPDAHRDPALRRYAVAQDKPLLVRFNERDSIVVAPPSFNREGDGWIEIRSRAEGDRPESLQEKAQKLGGTLEIEEEDGSGFGVVTVVTGDGRRIRIGANARVDIEEV